MTKQVKLVARYPVENPALTESDIVAEAVKRLDVWATRNLSVKGVQWDQLDYRIIYKDLAAQSITIHAPCLVSDEIDDNHTFYID